MIVENFEFKEGFPFKGIYLKKLKQFLNKMDLKYNSEIEYSSIFLDNGKIIATGSRSGNILVCFAIDPSFQGESLSTSLITKLIYQAHENSIQDLFIFTKPSNIEIFKNSFFYEILSTPSVALLSNKKHLVEKYLKKVRNKIPPAYRNSKKIGSVVMKADPFTFGHQYLLETASSNCDFLIVFVVEEGKTYFSYEKRKELIEKGVSHLKNVLVIGSSSLMVSPLTFPTYFYKEKSDEAIIDANVTLDLNIFSKLIAKPLNISHRYIGTEPYSEVTNIYNVKMKEVLPLDGILVTEIERKKNAEFFISATRVRELFERKDFEGLCELVPPTTLDSLRSMDV